MNAAAGAIESCLKLRAAIEQRNVQQRAKSIERRQKTKVLLHGNLYTVDLGACRVLRTSNHGEHLPCNFLIRARAGEYESIDVLAEQRERDGREIADIPLGRQVEVPCGEWIEEWIA